MKNRIVILMLALTISSTVFAFGQDRRLTAEQYRQMVADYSLRLKISRERSLSATDKMKAVKTGYYPSLSLAANGSYTLGNDVAFGDIHLKEYNYTGNLTLQQRIYSGGSVRNQSRAATIEADIAKIGEKDALQNVLYVADMLYLGSVAAYEQMLVMDQYVNIVNNLYSVVDTRFKDGYVSRTDLLMVETRLNEAKISQINSRKLYQQTIQQLNTELGVDPLTTYLLDTLSLPTMVDQASMDKILEQRADYVGTARQVDLAAANVRVARSRFNPQLVAGVQGIYGTQQLNFTGETKGYGAAFVQLSVPILMWGERHFTVSSVKANERSAVLAREQMRDQIQGQVANARIAMTQTYEQANMAMQNVRVASENLELNTFSYAEGRLPILDVLQSQISWIQSYTNMISSTYDYMSSVIDYRKSIGEIDQ